MTWLIATYRHTGTGDMSDITIRPGVELPEIPDYKLAHVNVRKEDTITLKLFDIGEWVKKAEKHKTFFDGEPFAPPKMKPPYTFFEF